VIDAHQHFWDPARVDYPWMTEELAPIRRAFGPRDLAPELARAGVDGTILVQTISSVDETRDFLATAAATPFVRGVVGWVDLEAPDAGDAIDALRAGPGGDRLVGIRHQVHDEPDPDWLDRSTVRRGIRAVGDRGLAYDLLVRARELPAAVRLVRDEPGIRFVLDHAGKPPIAGGRLDAWAPLVGTLGAHGNAWCKVSGLVTEADWRTWRASDLQPAVDRVLDAFGPERLLVGSDWPVCLVAATYREVLAATRSCLGGLSPAELERVLATNAADVYRL
jgi:L-fucono-1,5-lactonase